MSTGCGTYAGWNQHQRRGTPICDACQAAHAAYMRQYRATTPGVREADQWWNNTRKRALEQLAREYPARMREILCEIREAVQTG